MIRRLLAMAVCGVVLAGCNGQQDMREVEEKPAEEGLKIEAPGVDVEVGKEGVDVEAPGTHVDVDKEGVDVDAPDAKVDVQ
jgi:hypothetical protein